MKTVKIKAGTLLLWKEYGKWESFWNKIIRKAMPYNRLSMYFEDTEWVIINDETFNKALLLEPKKPYSRFEKEVLKIYDDCTNYMADTNERVLKIVNDIRPNTIDMKDSKTNNFFFESIRFNKFYKAVC